MPFFNVLVSKRFVFICRHSIGGLCFRVMWAFSYTCIMCFHHFFIITLLHHLPLPLKAFFPILTSPMSFICLFLVLFFNFPYNSNLVRIATWACRESIYRSIGNTTVAPSQQKLQSYVKLDTHLTVYTCHHNIMQNSFTTTNCMNSNHLS